MKIMSEIDIDVDPEDLCFDDCMYRCYLDPDECREICEKECYGKQVEGDIDDVDEIDR